MVTVHLPSAAKLYVDAANVQSFEAQRSASASVIGVGGVQAGTAVEVAVFGIGKVYPPLHGACARMSDVFTPFPRAGLLNPQSAYAGVAKSDTMHATATRYDGPFMAASPPT